MDADVARLVAEQRLREAGELAARRGDPTTASRLFEQACEFALAAEQALAAADPGRALPLALEGRAEDVATRALDAMSGDAAARERVAHRLEQRGDDAWAARLFASVGKHVEAARAYERAGDARAAADLLERAGDVVGAARALEAALRKSPRDAGLNVALGGLLSRYGKTEAAVRALQRVPAGAPERRAALTLLVDALDRLGLAQARAEADSELGALGGALSDAPPAPDRAEVKTRLFGRYEVAREIASSPSARVLECVDGVRGERVAVKIFVGYDARGAGRDALARFEREVRVLGALDHPNVVPLRDYLPEGPALVMAWMGGGTLEHRMADSPLTPARAAEIAAAVLAALGEAHRVGVIHRDIKPANVLFDDAGVTRLGDFGVAHLGDLSATATAGVIGTLGYMSPEQREGRAATVQSDLYGVGALLWEMLTGERPEATVGSRATTLRARPSAMHRDLDAAHDALVLSMLAEAPEGRPSDAFAARKALASLRWPDTVERAQVATTAPRSVRPAAGRLAPSAERPDLFVDQWLGRAVRCVRLDDATLARAAAFARADHPALQLVLRVDRETETLWLAPLEGAPLSAPLSDAQRAELLDALTQLHAAGAIHGHVDREHVIVDKNGHARLSFGAPADDGQTTADLDHLALARLAPP